ncbi:MAG: hypothetical protein ACNA8W_23705, partial [Bradymonadaceae bacterium]
ISNRRQIAAIFLGFGLTLLVGISAASAEDDPPNCADEQTEGCVWQLSSLAPNLHMVLEGSVFGTGQSESVGPSLRSTMGTYWTKGACPVGDEDYSKCDDIRFGMSVWPARTNGTTVHSRAHIYHMPDEDSADDVERELQNVQTHSTFWKGPAIRPLSATLKWYNEVVFNPGADAATKDTWYDRPDLMFAIIDDIPQGGDGNPNDEVRNSLLETCNNLMGRGAGESVNDHPAMPTWTMAPRLNPELILFNALVAAAGSTATCCLKNTNPAMDNTDKCCRDGDGNLCDGFYDVIIEDFCAHVARPVTTEAVLRQRIEDQDYVCGPGKSVHQTGTLWAHNKDSMDCLFHGSEHVNGNNCREGSEYDHDLFGMFTCIRQLPKGTSYEQFLGTDGDDDEKRFSFWYRPSDSLNPVLLTERHVDEDGNVTGNIEFIDPPRNTMFALTGAIVYENISGEDVEVDACGVVDDIEANTCRQLPGTPCDLSGPGKVGRCAVGLWKCLETGVDHCEQQYWPMPETCNGLDDDCDGRIDNMSGTSASTPALPAAHRGKACFGLNSCVCPNGSDPLGHQGSTLEEYLASHSNHCECREALSESGESSELPAATLDGKAACSALPASERSSMGLGGLGLLIFAL